MMTCSPRYLIAVLIILFSALNSNAAYAGKKIGVFLFSGETRYFEAYRGFRDKLKEEGFGEPGTQFFLENANANKATASELVSKFKASKMDLYFTVGTSATTMLSQAIKDKPIVFSVVYDPIKAGIAKTWRSSGNNTTGTSSHVPVTKVLDTLKMQKNVKRLAVLYTPGEVNSEYTVKELIETQEKYGVRIQPVPMSKKEDFFMVLPEVMRTSDAVYVTGSNFVDSQISAIAELAQTSKTITITHLEDLVNKGLLMGVTFSAYQLGQQAGEKAARILKGGKPAAIPIEKAGKYIIMLNMKSAATAQIQITPRLAGSVDRKIK